MAIVTTAYRFTESTAGQAAEVAGYLNLPLVERRKKSIRKLQEEHEDGVISVTKERIEYFPPGSGSPFFFHPSSSAFRTRRPLEEDPLISVSGLEPGDRFIDCTLGMGSDAIVAAARVGGKGSVIGCEADAIIAYIVRKGLKEYADLPHLIEPMRRIEVVQQEAASYLAALPDNFADVVYMDPMFTEKIEGAANFEVFRPAAAAMQLSDEWVAEAVRTAKKAVVLKAHFRSEAFEQFGFKRRIRPNTKFHYGVIAAD